MPKGSPKELPLSVPLTMVLLHRNVVLGAPSVRKDLERLFAEDEATITQSGSGGNESILIEWNGFHFAAFCVNKPIPEGRIFP